MANLQETQSSLKDALTRLSSVSNWDYWGPAPDADFPLVGSVWPVSVEPAKIGKPPVYEFLCTAALWADTPESLSAVVSDFLSSITENIGDSLPCLAEFTRNGQSISLGVLTVGLPSTSAASSLGPIKGIWSAVTFTVNIR